MDTYRWCEQCGTKMDYQRWFRANYCYKCGAELRKEPYVWRNQQEPIKVGVIPASAVRHLQVAGEAFKKHSGSCSAIAIGAGVAGLVLAPLAMAAGQTIMVLGGIVALASGYAGTKYNDDELGSGVKLGVSLLGVGALVYGSSYVLLVAGGMSVVSGIGLGAYTGVKAISKVVKSNRRIVNGRLLLMEGKHEQ